MEEFGKVDDLFEEVESLEEFLGPADEEESLDLLEDELTSLEEEVESLEPIEDELGKTLYIPKSCLDAGQIIKILRRMLRDMSPKYIDIAERTAYCSVKLFDYLKLHDKLDINIDRNKLILLSVLFSIGGYKDLTQLVGEEEPQSKVPHLFLYSYLFLKNLTPLRETSEAVLLYNYNYGDALSLNSPYIEYASLIFTCMRICIQLRKTKYVFDENTLDKEFIAQCKKAYNPMYVDLFIEANQNNAITSKLESSRYYYLLDEYCDSLTFNYDETFMLLKMMIYTIDFVSTSTVTHILSTSFHSTEICQIEHLSDEETDEVFTAAVLHDIGKMAIDVSILEGAGKLTDEEMNKMRSHVERGEKIFRGITTDKIADIASRHHETLNGSGYPKKLSGDDLTFQDRILTVADILSALTDPRTYKPSFPKEKTLSIMQSMVEEQKLDPKIFEDVKNSYDQIVAHTETRRPMLTTNLGQVIIGFISLQECKSVPALFRAIRQESAF
ncbi:MAG: HD domain-containing protein [Treponema sp.]|nr:HD domain-containing protein [Candidatus Treponema scatequi]